MTPELAYKIYLEKTNGVKNFLNSHIDDPQIKNTYINNIYYELFKKDPIFIWLGGGALGSSKVGDNIYFSTFGSLLSEIPSLSSISKKIFGFDLEYLKSTYSMLPQGNQKIFHDLTSLYLTYKAIGVEGMQALAIHTKMDSISTLINVFNEHTAISEKYKNFAKSDIINVEKLSAFFNMDDNAEAALEML